MPLTKLQFRPGINKEGTSYSNEGGYYDCDKIRFRSGYAEKIGGWTTYASGFVGAAGTMWNWVTYAGANLLALGTNQKYYVENGATFHDITPIRSTATGLSNIFATVAGSNQIVVTHSGHGATVGAFVTFSGASTFNDVTMNGEYQIVSVTDSNTYIVVYASNATGTGSGGGASITAEYQLNPGSITYTTAVGWGVPPWGAGGWGSATPVGVPPRLWSQDNFEQDLIFSYTGGNIYYWAADVVTYPRAVTLESYANTQYKTEVLTTAASAAGTSTITVAATDGINTGSIIVGTNIATGTYVAANWDYSTVLPLANDSVAAGSIITGAGVASGATITVNFAGRHAPDKTNFVIASDTAHFTIVLGSKPYNPENFDPTYDPMLVRWSDQDNPYEWVSETTNQSGEQHLSNGSYLVSAINTRQEILVWSDTALYSMQYIGPPYVWGFNLIGDNTSIISPNSTISVNTVVYWMGVDKFYQYNGRLETLSCTLWKYVYDNLNKTQASQVVCGSNEGFSEIWWFYPSKDSLVNDSYVIFNYLENTWYHGTMRRTAWLDSALRTAPMGVYSIQNSFLSASITSSDTSIALVDAQTYPLVGTITIDSEQITYTSISGNTLNGCVRGANGTTAAAHNQYAAATLTIPNQIVYHESGQDDGTTSPATAIYSYLDSSDFDIGDGNNFGFITRVVPDVTFRGSSTENPSLTLSFRARTNTTSDANQTSGSGSAYETKGTNPASVTRTTTSVVEQYTSQVFTRVRGRQAAFRVESSGTGVAWQVGAMRIDVRQDGRR